MAAAELNEVRPAREDARPEASTRGTAWVVVLLISALPQIVLQEFLGIAVPWMPWAIVAVTAALWLASRSVPMLAPLERFLAVMVPVGLVVALVPVIFGSALWKSIVPPSTQPMLILFAERLLLAVFALVLIGAALILGATRREAYLVVGDLNGPTTTRRRSGGYYGWMTAGPIAIVGIVALMVWFLFPRLPQQIDLAAALPFIGIGAIAALLNAFWEEVAFRAVPLSMLQRAVGPSMGVLMLALYFGLGHFYGGIPPAWMGLIAASAIGLLFGRAMIETRGLGWPLALHFAGDLVIFTILAIASVS
jgi:membrane protease YdiL (CAAX protease family)